MLLGIVVFSLLSIFFFFSFGRFGFRFLVSLVIVRLSVPCYLVPFLCSLLPQLHLSIYVVIISVACRISRLASLSLISRLLPWIGF